MNDWLGLLFQIFLIITALAVVFHKNHFTIIILMSVFSIIAATLYMINQAPDVAIAEAAINAAIIPLIYVIAISRQRELIVYDKLHHGSIDPTQPLVGEIYVYLDQFSLKHKLKLNLCRDLGGNDQTVFKDLNVDVLVDLDKKAKQFILKGKSSNVLMKKMMKDLKGKTNIRFEMLEEGDYLD
jgi:putative multicomponent Na+:H+ antiporter subunit B